MSLFHVTTTTHDQPASISAIQRPTQQRKNRALRLTAMFFVSVVGLGVSVAVVFSPIGNTSRVSALTASSITFFVIAYLLVVHNWFKLRRVVRVVRASSARDRSFSKDNNSSSSISQLFPEVNEQAIPVADVTAAIIASQKSEVDLRIRWEKLKFLAFIEKRISGNEEMKASQSSVGFHIGMGSVSYNSCDMDFFSSETDAYHPFRNIEEELTRLAPVLRQMDGGDPTHCLFTTGSMTSRYQGTALERRVQLTALKDVFTVLKRCPFANQLVLPSTVVQYPADSNRFWLATLIPDWSEHNLKELETNDALRRSFNVNTAVSVLRHLVFVVVRGLHFNGVAHRALTPTCVVLDSGFTQLSVVNLSHAVRYPSHRMHLAGRNDKLGAEGFSNDLTGLGNIAEFLLCQLHREMAKMGNRCESLNRVLSLFESFMNAAKESGRTFKGSSEDLLTHPLISDPNVVVPIKFMSSSGVQLSFDETASALSMPQSLASGTSARSTELGWALPDPLSQDPH